MVDFLTVSRKKLQDIVRATANDETLQRLATVIAKDWEETNVPLDVKPYHCVHDEVSVQNGIYI